MTSAGTNRMAYIVVHHILGCQDEFFFESLAYEKSKYQKLLVNIS